MAKRITVKEIEKHDDKVIKEQEDMNKSEEKKIMPYIYCFFGIGLITFIYVFILYGMQIETKDKIIIGLSCTSFIGLAIGMIGISIVKKTVGLDLATKLFKMRKLRYKGNVLLKIFNVNGRPEYRIVKAAPRIPYKFKEGGEEKKKVVFYDPYGKYEDFVGIPMIECNPNDIQLKNTYNGSRIGTAPEIVEKNIVDNSMSAQQVDTLKNQRKWILIAFGICAGLALLGFDLYAQRLAQANEATVKCYQDMGKTAVVGAGIWFQNKRLKW